MMTNILNDYFKNFQILFNNNSIQIKKITTLLRQKTFTGSLTLQSQRIAD